MIFCVKLLVYFMWTKILGFSPGETGREMTLITRKKPFPLL